MKLETIITKGVLYDKCENMEELYDDYYFPLLVEFKELQKQNIELKEKITLLQASEPMLEFAKQTYKDNWNKLKEWLKDENNQQYSKYIYNYSINNWVLNKMQEIEGGINE